MKFLLVADYRLEVGNPLGVPGLICNLGNRIPEAQYVETRIINLFHYQTLIASKASRMVLAARGRKLVDFGLRRAHGA